MELHPTKKVFNTVKETIAKTRWPVSEWEKIFANDMINKGLLSKIYKELTQLNIKNKNNPIKNWAEELHRHFSKADIWKDVQYHSSLGKCRIKPTMRYHLSNVSEHTHRWGWGGERLLSLEKGWNLADYNMDRLGEYSAK